MENIVLVVHCFLMFQNITGCKSLAAKDKRWRESAFGGRSLGCSVSHGKMLTAFLVWSHSAVEW